MSATWSYPYFSGAANLFEHGSWFINTEQLQQFYQLDQSDFPYFNFEASDSITEYNYNAVGYVYIVSAAQFIFPFLTQMQSVVLFQAIIHLVFVGWVLNSLDSSWAKVIFTLLYALNPLVLKFVLFAFYYFWQVIPSIAFLILAKYPKPSLKMIFMCTILMFCCYFIRPTTLVFSLFVLVFGCWQSKRILSWLSIPLFIVAVTLGKGINSQPWHTMYVGLGAHDNFDIALSDESGYQLFHTQNKTVLSNVLPDGNFYDANVRSDYYGILKDTYLTILEDSPILLLENALKNTLMSYSFGYIIESKGLQSLAILSGGMFVLALLGYGLFTYFLAIGFSVGGFALFYPPIPAYMYGSYIILVVALIELLKKMKKRHASSLSKFC